MQWPKVQLGTAVTILDSMRKPVKAGDRIEGPYPYYGANGQQGTINDFIFDEPLILVAEDGGHFFDPSRPIAYRIEGKTWVNNHAHVLRCNPDMDVSYLCHQLARYNVEPYLTGSTRAKLTKGALERIPITKPPLEEQKRIAAILDKADEIKSSSKSAKEIRKQIIRNSYLDLFGDPLDPENNTVKLSEIATITMGQSPPGTSYNDEGEGIPLLNGPAEFGEQHPVEVQWTNLPKKLCQSDDILICVRGATAGRLNVADKEYCLGRGLAAIRPIENSDISSDFIIESLHFYYDYFHQKGTGSTFININKEMLSELKIPLAEKTNIQLYSKLKNNLSSGTGEAIQNTHLLVNSLVQEILS